MFMWQADRPCPKCSTKAPGAYENPELLSYGGSGMAAALIPAEIESLKPERDILLEAREVNVLPEVAEAEAERLMRAEAVRLASR